MTSHIGIILLEKSEIIIRIYEVSEKEWKLTLYQSTPLHTLPGEQEDASKFVEILAEFFITNDAQRVGEWKTCARDISRSLTAEIANSLGLIIENLTPLREQELLCKGMFTELW